MTGQLTRSKYPTTDGRLPRMNLCMTTYDYKTEMTDAHLCTITMSDVFILGEPWLISHDLHSNKSVDEDAKCPDTVTE